MGNLNNFLKVFHIKKQLNNNCFINMGIFQQIFIIFFKKILNFPFKKSQVLMGCKYKKKIYVVELKKLIKCEINQIQIIFSNHTQIIMIWKVCVIHLIILKGYEKKLFIMIRQLDSLTFFVTFTYVEKLQDSLITHITCFKIKSPK